MSYNSHVLRCHHCDTFQVHCVKKSKKWECKVCFSKQSLKQVYGTGTAKECRLHTQKLNYLKSNDNENDLDCISIKEPHMSPRTELKTVEHSSVSKWSAFIEDDKNEDINIETPGEIEYVLEIPKAAKRMRNPHLDESSPISDQKSVSQNSTMNKKKCVEPIKIENEFVSDLSEKNSIKNGNISENNITDLISHPPEKQAMNVIFKSNPADRNSKWFKYTDEADDASENDLNLSTNQLNNSAVDPVTDDNFCFESPRSEITIANAFFKNIDDDENLDDIFNI